MLTKNSASKNKSQAYQRWVLKALDQPEELNEPQVKEVPQESEASALAPQGMPTEAGTSIHLEEAIPVALPTEAEVAAVFQSAKDEGYATGYQEGHAAGYAEGRGEAEVHVKAEAVRIQALLSQLDQDLHAVDQQMADQLLELAITLTKKMVTQALKLKPELIVPIVQEAIRNLPAAMQHPRLYLHPEDAKLVSAHLSEQIAQENWSIREDERLTRGGCRIEANGCEINGDLEARWHRVLSAIGQQDDWLERSD